MEGVRTSIEPISTVFPCRLVQVKRDMYSVWPPELTTIAHNNPRAASGFSNGQWLCCSTFTQTAQSSR
jgi:hypothetical protein